MAVSYGQRFCIARTSTAVRLNPGGRDADNRVRAFRVYLETNSYTMLSLDCVSMVAYTVQPGKV